jgi:large subunit ribosomal protein L7/L12
VSEKVNVSEKLQQIIDTVKGLTVMELADLVKALEQELGVSAAVMAAPMATASGGAAAATEATEEPTEFNVILVNDGGQKIPAIKVVRAITDLGLADAKAFVESLPKAVKEGVDKAAAEEIKKKFDEIGAKVEIKGV